MATSELLLNVFFYIFALAALGGGIAVALSRNIVRSAFALLTVLFGVAAMYAFMRADFIVVAQIIIYVGGILVLIIFAVMLTHKITDVKLSNESAPGPAAIFGCGCVFISLLFTILPPTGPRRWNRAVEPNRVTVSLPEGRPAVGLRLHMTQGDGSTGILPGEGHALDGFIMVHAEAPARLPSERAKVRFRVEEREKGKPGWKELSTQVAKFDEARRANASFERLAPGPYRWSARIEDDAMTSAWAPFASHRSEDAPDFTSRPGLTRALGLALAGPYLLPFEVVSVLLLAALVGAAYLARKEVKE